MKYRIIHVHSNNTFQVEKKKWMFGAWEFVVAFETYQKAYLYIAPFYAGKINMIEA